MAALRSLLQKKSSDVVVLAAVRSPITRAFKGGMKDAWPEDILRPVVREAVQRARIEFGDVNDVMIGNVLAELGFAKTGRMAINDAGFPNTTTFHTVNRQCSSSLQAITHMSHAIMAGQIDVGLGGGVESMSKNYGSRGIPQDVGPSLRHSSVKDALDCLMPMGMTSENVAERYGVTRQMQDEFGLESHRRASEAQRSGRFDSEIVPITIKTTNEAGKIVETVARLDDGIRHGLTMEKMKTFKPAFKPDGASTGGNSSQISDGASATVLARRSWADERGLKPIGRFLGTQVSGCAPDEMGIGPIPAITTLLKRLDLTVPDIDILELNEAFASQTIYCIDQLGFDYAKVNPNGGAIALGHPTGATGARQTATLLAELLKLDKELGIVSMCARTAARPANSRVAPEWAWQPCSSGNESALATVRNRQRTSGAAKPSPLRRSAPPTSSTPQPAPLRLHTAPRPVHWPAMPAGAGDGAGNFCLPPTDSLVFTLRNDTRLGTPSCNAIFNDEAYINRCIDAETALARAQSATGVIPKEVGDAITRSCRSAGLDMDRLRRETEIVGYPILPLIRQLASMCDEPVGRYIHWGATTQDIMDMASILQIKSGLQLVGSLLDETVKTLELLAQKHRDTPMAGRTHLQHALPVTFGYKCAVWLSSLQRHQDRLAQLLPRALLVQYGGAAGSLASLGSGGAGLQVRKQLAKELGLQDPSISWHVARDGIAEVVNFLALVGGSLGKIAYDLILMSSNEFGEVSEPFVPHRGASSTMPQKRNPISSEVILAASKILRANAGLVLDGMVADFERASGPWHLEWVAVPESFVIAVGALSQANFALSGLVVNTDKMASNLHSTRGLIVGEAVMMGLAPHVGRGAAHDIVYECCKEAIEHDKTLLACLLARDDVTAKLSATELQALCDPVNYMGACMQMWWGPPLSPVVNPTVARADSRLKYAHHGLAYPRSLASTSQPGTSLSYSPNPHAMPVSVTPFKERKPLSDPEKVFHYTDLQRSKPTRENDPYEYQSGFGNRFQSEVLPGTLPVAQNNPQGTRFGLYTEGITYSSFGAPRHANRSTYMYRVRPAAAHNGYKPVTSPAHIENCFLSLNTAVETLPEQAEWAPFPIPGADVKTDFVDGLHALGGSGDPNLREGIALYVYTFNSSMSGRAFCNVDGDFLFTPQQGILDMQTELGKLFVQPGEIAVVPRGVRFSIKLLPGVTAARGYITEIWGSSFELPDLGPLGGYGLANARDFLHPVAFIDEDLHQEYEIVHKHNGKYVAIVQDHSPYDIVAWHGNYDLTKFCSQNSTSVDHTDPSVNTVLTAKSHDPNTTLVDFLWFGPRWDVASNTFRLPYFHRNSASEFLFSLYGKGLGRSDDFLPGGGSFEGGHTPHGGFSDAYVDEMRIQELPPRKILEEQMTIMVESCRTFLFTEYARKICGVMHQQGTNPKVWDKLPDRFSTNPAVKELLKRAKDDKAAELKRKEYWYANGIREPTV
ncbi:uncharacterized protein V1518DRAFT_458137 [Limtongia smithiae]|uniref:uncharacterized protein n=1 Tax=Limtongia smithiae TaxID=1125753 RepID=UPI0034CE07FE